MYGSDIINSKVSKWLGLDINDYRVKDALSKLEDTTFIMMNDEKFDYYDKNEPYVIYLGKYTYCRERILELTDARMFIALVSEVLNVMTNYYYKFRSDYTDILSVRGASLINLYDIGSIDEFLWCSKKASIQEYVTSFDEKFAHKADRYPLSKTSNNKAMLLRYALIEEGWKELGDIQVIFHDDTVLEFVLMHHGVNGRHYRYNLKTKKMMTSNFKDVKRFNEAKEVLIELSDI